MRVLVVDDDADIRETVRLILEDEGYDVEAVPDGAAALSALNDGARPDLVLLDLMMPVMDGWRFREEQLRDPSLAAIPVIVLSADANLRDKAQHFGGRYLAKPVNIDALLDAVAAHRPD